MSIFSKNKHAYLILESGIIFRGYSFGYNANCVGELVFNTAITGYQEIISDPSYKNQIVTFSYPHIGNTGCNSEDFESDNHTCEAIIVRDIATITDNSRSEYPLSQLLIAKKIPALTGIDTREVVKLIRSSNAQNSCIIVDAETEQQAIDKSKKIICRIFWFRK